MRLVVTEPKERIAEWVFKNIHGGSAPIVDAAIGLVDGNDLIAGVAFTDYNGRSIGMHVAAGKKNWLSKDFLWAAFFYPFIQVGVKKILFQMDSLNSDALAFNARLGGVVEHIIKDAGTKGDMVISSMTKEQCKWLHIDCALKRAMEEQHGKIY